MHEIYRLTILRLRNACRINSDDSVNYEEDGQLQKLNPNAIHMFSLRAIIRYLLSEIRFVWVNTAELP